ncbi:MAG: tetratricopeptide repeat protein [Acidobacteria bacterium]|nr:tetratricopeptide repeat protein [Acidobacteriota bacterium]
MILAAFLFFLAQNFDLRGTLLPATQASVSLHGSTSPFNSSTLAGPDGRFRFKKLEPGTYTLIVFVPGRGELRKTIEVTSAVSSSKGRIEIAVRLDDAKFAPDRSSVVTMRELAIPDSARNEFRRAMEKLESRDVEAAIEHLNRAVELAPQFVAAWNHLGTIAYQTRRYTDAETFFRRSLEADPNAYEPLVNLGGVLVTLGRFEEAWTCNLHATLQKPTDALAHSQMGMTYAGLNRPDLAEKYLLEAIRLDPAHFSHPQLLLAEIYAGRGQRIKAANALEDFLRHHPGYSGESRLREAISKLRGSPGT